MARLFFSLALVSVVFCLAVNGYTWRIGYALWPLVGDEAFGDFHAAYLRRLGPVITGPHVAMAFLCGRVVWSRPAWFPLWQAETVCVLALAVIAVSLFGAGPVHDRFTRNRRLDERGFRRLMRISAWRTAMLTLASGVLLAGLWRGLR